MTTTPDKITVRIAVIAWRDSDGVVHYDACGWATDASEPKEHFIHSDNDISEFGRRRREDYEEVGDSWGQPFIIEAEIEAPPPISSAVVKGVVR